MSNVQALAKAGLTPSLVVAMDGLLNGLSEAVKSAQDAGVPAGLIVGQLEFYKAALIQQTFENKEV